MDRTSCEQCDYYLDKMRVCCYPMKKEKNVPQEKIYYDNYDDVQMITTNKIPAWCPLNEVQTNHERG